MSAERKKREKFYSIFYLIVFHGRGRGVQNSTAKVGKHTMGKKKKTPDLR